MPIFGRVLPPVSSPLTLGALGRGVRTALGGVADGAPEVERQLATRFASSRIVLTDSGTSALTLAMQLADAGRNLPVALPAYGCFDLATAADGAGLRAVLYDVDPTTLAPNAESLAAALALAPASVVVAHFYGVPVDTRRIRAQVEAAGALLIDDAAQGIGALVDGRPAGLGGALGVLSFGRGKGVTGGGGGALLVPNDSPCIAQSRALALTPAAAGWFGSLAKGGAQWLLARPSLYAIPSSLPFLGLGETRYHAPHAVTAMPSFALGVLSVTAGLADTEIATRRAHAERLRRVARDAGWEVPHLRDGLEPGWLRLPLMLPMSVAPETIPRHLGVTRGYPQSLADLSGFGERTLLPAARYPGARALAARLVTLPTHGQVRERDLAALERWLRAPQSALPGALPGVSR